LIQIISEQNNNIQNLPNMDVDCVMLNMTYYNYEEGDTPEAFFVPFSWNCAINTCCEINWNVNVISIFDITNSGIKNNSNNNNYKNSSQEIDNFGLKHSINSNNF
jgi:hypothetical protein